MTLIIALLLTHFSHVSFMEKPGNSSLVVKFERDTERVTFLVKMQVDDLHLYLKYHFSTSVHTFF